MNRRSGLRAPAASGAGLSKAPAPRGVGEIRIIGGQWKRTRLKVPDRPGLRPTPDRVRETLFNWLGQDMTGWRCVDAFAGTGALGLEAASRGAREVLMVEQDAGLVANLREAVQKLGAQAVQVLRGDGVAQLQQRQGDGVDLVFLDPPFAGEFFEAALQAAASALAPNGAIYLEAPVAWEGERLALYGLVADRYLKAGAVHAHLLRPLAPA